MLMTLDASSNKFKRGMTNSRAIYVAALLSMRPHTFVQMCENRVNLSRDTPGVDFSWWARHDQQVCRFLIYPQYGDLNDVNLELIWFAGENKEWGLGVKILWKDQWSHC